MKLQTAVFLFAAAAIFCPGQAFPHDGAENDLPDEAVFVRPDAKLRGEIQLLIAGIDEKKEADFLRLNGIVRLNQDRTAKIMPYIQGFISTLHASEGTRVKKGDPLATLTSYKVGEYYANFNTALEEEDLAKSNMEMAQKLLDRNAVSRKEYLQYKNAYASAVVKRKHAEELLISLLPSYKKSLSPDRKDKSAVIRLTYDVVSPFDGTVIEKTAALGENFAEDNTRHVFVVSDLEHPWIDLSASPSDMRKIQPGMRATAIDAETGERIPATVVFKSGILDPKTRNGIVRLEAENLHGILRPGQLAAAEIELNRHDSPLTIPAKAVCMKDGVPFVFVPAGDGFAMRRIQVGTEPRNDGGIVVLSGLLPGEKYVADGSRLLAAASNEERTAKPRHP